MAYCYQKQGRVKDAHNIYTHILKCKIEDAGLLGVISNNLVTINKDQNLFDSKKKMKVATHDGLEHKLNSMQRKFIQINNCLLLYYLNQTDNCRKQCQIVVQKWPEAWPYIAAIESQMLTREGKNKEAVEYLLSKCKDQPDNKLYYQLIATHLLLMNVNVAG